MTTGDEPMLPQPSDDNAPMISGRGTKVIADARGAYLAGNLDALIERMDEQQQLRFRQALVQYGLILANSLLAFDEDNNLLTAIECAQQWLANPIHTPPQIVLRRLLELGSITPAGDRHFYPQYEIAGYTYSTENGAVAVALSIAITLYEVMSDYIAKRIPKNAAFMTMICHQPSLLDLDQEKGAWSRAYNEIMNPIIQWQLDAVWAILLDDQLPSFPELPT
jgi:hypothetical protein